MLTILKTAIFETLSVAKALKVVENLPLLGYNWEVYDSEKFMLFLSSLMMLASL